MSEGWREEHRAKGASFLIGKGGEDTVKGQTAPGTLGSLLGSMSALLWWAFF